MKSTVHFSFRSISLDEEDISYQRRNFLHIVEILDYLSPTGRKCITLRAWFSLFLLTSSALILLCASSSSAVAQDQPADPKWLDRLHTKIPHQWGQRVSGVKHRLHTHEPVIALTFNACGGAKGSQFDAVLIDDLQRQQIPATLFINRQWIAAQPQVFQWLADNPLFEIENHGDQHRPLSVNGRSIHHTKGTTNLQAAFSEVEKNDQTITQWTGRSPQFFRSGTAYYDEIAVKMVEQRGDQVVNYEIAGHTCATYTKEQVKQILLSAKPGAIIALQMNQPQSDTAEGLREAIPLLRQKGFRFVHLEDYPLME